MVNPHSISLRRYSERERDWNANRKKQQGRPVRSGLKEGGKLMLKLAKKISRAAGLIFLISMLAGCATDRKITLLYQPSVFATGGSGTLYLAASGARPASGKTDSVQWIIGKVKNSDGDTVGDVVTTIAPGDLILDAFNQELTRAGYKVMRVKALPGDVSKGVDVSGLNINMLEVTSIMKSEGKSNLTVSLELWKNGKKFKKLDYQTGFSDFALKDRNLLLPEILQKALQNLMEQAVPEIIRDMGK